MRARSKNRRDALFGGIVVAALGVAMVTAQIANSDAPPPDDAIVAGTILPPGQDMGLHALAEVAPYDNLVYDYPALTSDTLNLFFKNAQFGVIGTIERVYSPRPGVRVVRDARWGVPHIVGDTDEDAWFGAGYVTAEDRLPIMDVLRALGRAEAFELIDTVPAWLADAELVRLYGYSEEEFEEQLERLPKRYGPEGAEIRTAIREYIAGVNSYVTKIRSGDVPVPPGYVNLGKLPLPWRETDVVAVAGIIRALFGAGGGSELSNASFLAGLIADFGPDEGRKIYEDFRNRFNYDGPVHTPDSQFRYNTQLNPIDDPLCPGDPSALDPNATVLAYSSGKQGLQITLENLPGDLGRLAPELSVLADRAAIRWDRLVLDTPLGSVDLRPRGMSNFLAISRDKASGGHPILLGGPQAAYFSPEILNELDIHSPTIDARGAAFPGISMFVLLGRGIRSAWTATAGGSDMIDTRIERLCEVDGATATEHSYGYRYKGDCLPMDRRLYRSLPHVPGAQAFAELPDIWAERTIHGPVIARGTVGGEPVAVVRQRSTYRREVDSAIAFLRLNRNQVDMSNFVEVFGDINYATNWGFIDDQNVAYYHGGLYPRRPASVDTDFPVWGTGEWEWQSDPNDANEPNFLEKQEHPHIVGKTDGYVTSWNSRPAPCWGASDEKYGWSSLYRVNMLNDRIESDPDKITPVELVQMMEQAALTDLRGSRVLPLALDVLAAAAAPSERETEMVDLLDAWRTQGRALRRDGDRNGHYEHGAAIAIMDAWWPALIHAIYDPVVGDVSRVPQAFDNAPGPTGSAYQDGFYGQVWTDLAQVLGRPVKGPTSRIYCGGGNLAACSAALWASLQAAGDSLAGQQGQDPQGWDVEPELERIRFLPGAAVSMHWVNRPTFQQLMQFRSPMP